MSIEDLPGVSAVDGTEPRAYDIPAEQWVSTIAAVRDLGFAFFDWLSAVDELDEGFTVVVHLARVDAPDRSAPAPAGDGARPLEHVLLRTRVPRDNAVVDSLSEVFAGAIWHERETHEMFGIGFDGHPGLMPLLLPDEFEGHPLRKEFVLASRVAKAWPGAKEPGESDSHRAPSRRRVAPPGVPSAEEWGPREP